MAKNVGKIGEELFEQLCKFQSWEYEKIPRAEVPTPDYEVKTSQGIFISEVSFVNIEMELGKAYSITPGDAVRNKIKKKMPQIRNTKYPTLLTLCGSAPYLGYESIAAAMYGDLTLSIGVESGKILDKYHGKNSKLRESLNTELSAIAFLTLTLKNQEDILIQNPDLIPHITIYHNIYAKTPFSKDFFGEVKGIYQNWFNKESNVA